MLLVIDVGNTNIVFAIYEGDTLRECWRSQSNAVRTCDQYAAFLDRLLGMAKIPWEALSDVVISSVVPEVNFHLRGFCSKYLNVEPLVIQPEDVDIEIDLNAPEEVGADRLVNALAVKESYSLPAVVIDFGTATTFDVLDKEGRYIGGMIAPGISLSVSALHQMAAKLPMVSIKKPEKIIGKNTVGAMQSGVFYGYLGLIEKILGEIAGELGEQPYVLATGGLAPLFADSTDMINKVDDTLTLRGLLSIYQAAKKKKKAA